MPSESTPAVLEGCSPSEPTSSEPSSSTSRSCPSHSTAARNRCRDPPPGFRPRSPASGLRRRRPSSRGRSPRSPRSLPAAPSSRQPKAPGGASPRGPARAPAAPAPQRRVTRRAARSSGGHPCARQRALAARPRAWPHGAGRRAAPEPGGVRRGPRGSRRSRPWARSTGSASCQLWEGTIPKRRAGRRAACEVRESCDGRPQRAGAGEGTHRPGRRRVQPRAPRTPSPALASSQTPTARPFAGLARPRCVGEVVAGGFLLVVGAVPPVEGCDPCGDTGRAGGGGGPPGGVSLGRAATDRLPGAVEARRSAEVEAEQEARRAPRLMAVAGAGEGDRDGPRVARPASAQPSLAPAATAPLRRSVRAGWPSSDRVYMRPAQSGAPGRAAGPAPASPFARRSPRRRAAAQRPSSRCTSAPPPSRLRRNETAAGPRLTQPSSPAALRRTRSRPGTPLNHASVRSTASSVPGRYRSRTPSARHSGSGGPPADGGQRHDSRRRQGTVPAACRSCGVVDQRPPGRSPLRRSATSP